MKDDSAAGYHSQCPRGTVSVSPAPPFGMPFWEENARWYDQWVSHNRYHEPILHALGSLPQPGWRVLDIGGATGVLSRPLADMGCHVTLLEPCRAMQRLFEARTRAVGFNRITVDPRRWEDVCPSDYDGWDLVIASNSLHLTSLGIDAALQSLLMARPRHAFLVWEGPKHPSLAKIQGTEYGLGLVASHRVESSFVYHSRREAADHLRFRHRWFPWAPLNPEGLDSLQATGAHYIDRDLALVNMARLDRRDRGRPYIP